MASTRTPVSEQQAKDARTKHQAGSSLVLGRSAAANVEPAATSRSPWARLGLVGLSVLAVVLFAVYAASLASRAGEVSDAVPISVPGEGQPALFGTGQAAPDFTLESIDGPPVRLADLAGRPVWINVWASWCAPCRAEMPEINAVYQEVRAAERQRTGQTGDEQGLVLLLISLGEDPNVVRGYLQSTKYQLPVLVDPTFSITRGYRITGLPTHYFIGREGTIHDLAIGGLKPNAMRARLAKILGG